MSADPASRAGSVDLLLPTARGQVVAEGSVTAPRSGRSVTPRTVLFLLAALALAGSVTAAVRVGTADVGWTDLARSLGTQIGREITRSIFGTARRRR